MTNTATDDLSIRRESLHARLSEVGQAHLLAFADELDPPSLASLLDQIASLPIEVMPAHVERYVLNAEPPHTGGEVLPAAYVPHNPRSAVGPWDHEAMKSAGEKLIREGALACFTVAGGQGSRLGYDGPKGCYPVGPVTNKPLFAIFAEQILAGSRRYGVTIPWLVMTSPLNHEATVQFFEEHHHFGLEHGQVTFFQQGVMPSMDLETGKILLAERGVVATNPDGHGGSLTAIQSSGELDRLKAMGVKHISYFQVDNPHARAVDPVFLGLHVAHASSSGEMSSKMVPKTEPSERVGVFATRDGKATVLEYSDLPQEMAERLGDDGRLAFLSGSIAIHLISVEYLERLTSPGSSMELPFHRAIKKVAHIDIDSGNRVDPDAPNAVKLERFVFDALEGCKRSLVYETDRVDEFAPVKNATGTDSVESSKALQVERACRWLESVSIPVPRKTDGSPACTIELSPLTALEPADLKDAKLPDFQTGGSYAI